MENLIKHIAWFYMTGVWPKNEIDHKDLDKSNNKWSNLREATHQQNMTNLPPKKSKTGFRGIKFYKENRYRVVLQVKGKKIHIGLFDFLDDAIKARNDAMVQYFEGFSKIEEN